MVRIKVCYFEDGRWIERWFDSYSDKDCLALLGDLWARRIEHYIRPKLE